LNKPENIAAVILAAGGSSRLGKPKQLVPFADKTLLQHMLDTVSQFSFGSKLLVLGANSSQIKTATSTQGFEVIHNTEWSRGIGTSISLATRQVIKISSIQHLIFFLSDQPFVDTRLIEKLINSHKNEITACLYQDEVGVPAVFARSYFTELSELAEDSGAKKIIKKHLAQTSIVDFEMGHWDIDTKEDIEKLETFKREQP